MLRDNPALKAIINLLSATPFAFGPRGSSEGVWAGEWVGVGRARHDGGQVAGMRRRGGAGRYLRVAATPDRQAGGLDGSPTDRRHITN